MKLSSFFVYFMFLSGLLTPAFAESGPKIYTLDELYKTALENAEQIGIADEAVAIAEYTRKQALSVLFPTITAFGDYQHYFEEKIVHDNVIQPQWDGSYGVTLGQSFTINGRELTALRIAGQGVEKSKLDLDAAKESYLYTVASAFFDVAKARQAVQIANANVIRLNTYKKAVATRLKLSDISKTELFRTEAELASAEVDLLKAENTQKLARAFLARLAAINASFKIAEPDISLADLETADLDKLKRTAYENRADLKSYGLSERMAANQVSYARGAYWPRLSIQGSWAFLEQEPEPMLDESGSIGAGLTFDIFDGGLRKARVSEARAHQKQAELAFQNAKSDILIEVETAYLNWQTQKSIIDSFESRLRYAKENYEASIRLFENGMANSVDVMDANTLLVTAEWQLAEARYNLQLAVLGVERSTGDFLTAILDRLKK